MLLFIELGIPTLVYIMIAGITYGATKDRKKNADIFSALWIVTVPFTVALSLGTGIGNLLSPKKKSESEQENPQA